MLSLLFCFSAPFLAAGRGGETSSAAHRNCRTCHTSHTAPGPGLISAPSGDELCASCHQRTAELGIRNPDAAAPVQIETWKGTGSSHLTETLALKNAKAFVRVAQKGGRRVVLRTGCGGCHDAHARGPRKLREVSFDVQGRLESLGTAPALASQVCFGCHAGREAVRVRRARDAQHDFGTKFAPGAASSHTMGARASDRPDLPSLNGTTFVGRLDCTSCHASPPGESSRGPHTSPYPHLLVAPYGTETDGELPERANELCYTCHSRLSIDGNQSFPLHREHIRGFRGNAGTVSTRKLATRAEGHAATGGIPKRPGDLRPGGAKSFGAGFGRPTPCATCHDPHGSIQNPALVRFDTSVVRPASVGGPDYRRTGQGHGSCTLTCHGQEHIQARY